MVNLLIPKKIIFPLSIFALIFGFFGVIFKITHVHIGLVGGNVILAIYIIIGGIVWLTVFYDIVRNKIQNKFLWILFMLTLGIIPCVFYLAKRENYILK